MEKSAEDNGKYRYRPVRFYAVCFASTWTFWIAAAFLSRTGGGSGVAMILLLLGLASPAAAALVTVFTSKSAELKSDFRRKLSGFYRLKPLNILLAVAVFAAIVASSILISLLFGQSLSQFSFTEDFSFSIGGSSALLTILLASVIEEIGWRGYGEDSVAAYCSWFTESVIFGFVWALWHLPLFWIDGTYHAGLRELGALYVLNFLVSVSPLGFLTTWVYVKNNRSMLACIIFHLFVNTMQEKIAMTPVTKCIETAVVTVAAAAVVLFNRGMFFETRREGKLLTS